MHVRMSQGLSVNVLDVLGLPILKPCGAMQARVGLYPAKGYTLGVQHKVSHAAAGFLRADCCCLGMWVEGSECAGEACLSWHSALLRWRSKGDTGAVRTVSSPLASRSSCCSAEIRDCPSVMECCRDGGPTLSLTETEPVASSGASASRTAGEAGLPGLLPAMQSLVMAALLWSRGCNSTCSSCQCFSEF